MTMQHNIDTIRRNFGRNMHQPKRQALPGQIDNQRPVVVPVAISADDRHRRTNRFEIQRNRRFANIAKVPDLVRVQSKVDHLRRQLVMRVGQHEYLHSTESRTTDTTGTKIATSNFVVTLVRGTSLTHVI